MAEKKNFTIENYNGTDYDTLYPQTNSGQVLLDKTAQDLLNLESGKTVNDAFTAVSDGDVSYKVGDTLTTARTDLGDKWLLCNGAQYTTIQYPELSPLFQSKELNFIQQPDVDISNISSNLSQLQVVSNEQLNPQFLGSYTNGNLFYLFYTNNLLNSNSYTKYNLGITLTYKPNISNLNNNWVILGNKYSKYISGDISTGTINNIYSKGTNYTFSSNIYNDGKYFFVVRDTAEQSSYYIYIYSALNQNPIEVTLSSYSGEYGSPFTKIPEGVAMSGYQKTFYVVSSSGNLNSYNYQNLNTYNAYKCLYYIGGKYYIILTQTSSVDKNTYVYSSTSLDSFVLLKVYPFDITVEGYLQLDDKIVFANGYYMDVNGEIKSWVNYTAPDKNGYETSVVVGGDKLYRLTSTSSNGIVKPYTCNIAPSFNLPSVSIGDGLYTYIKAKS